MNGSSDRKKRRIERLLACHRVCLSAVETGQHDSRPAAAGQLWMLFLCSEVCRLGAECLERGAQMDESTLALSAGISAVCGLICERVDGNAPWTRACARTCFRCSESCLALLFHDPDSERILAAANEAANFLAPWRFELQITPGGDLLAQPGAVSSDNSCLAVVAGEQPRPQIAQLR
ncbi:MAG TPA: hypothetical protein VGW33_04015 [Terriglobia bacterium]|nr:hypothetical protein [Terriglobia bacterium]